LTGERPAIFGGAFDPIHNAHLAVAQAAAERFRLDRVLFVPTYRPPHKGGVTHAPYEDRVRMVEIACAELNCARRQPAQACHANVTRFEASRLEEGTECSYSIDTIAKLRASLCAEDELFFLIGADAFAELRAWHRWRDVARAVTFIVVSRPGYRYDAPAEAKVERLDEMELITSSSDLRRRLAAPNRLLDAPPGVIEYIRLHGLYADSQV
jgi:nicotinate-nucleotide adenylyltransferase